MGKQKNITKRDFLKLSATGLAGAFLAQHISAIQTKVISEAKPEDKAKPVERMLGKTGISLPVISSGSFIVDNPNLARAVMRSGVKYLDSLIIRSLPSVPNC